MEHSNADSTERFSDRVENYVRFRPGYPTVVLEILKQEIRLDASWTTADVGSGTGISAELFLRNGNFVYGVEPNGPMRAAAERLLAGYPNFHSIAGTAEFTSLPDRCVDAVVAAQAFHWFDARGARKEAQRILKLSGWSVLLWNTRRLNATPFLRAYEEMLLVHGTDYQRVRHDKIDAGKLAEFYGGGDYSARSIPNEQRLTLEALRGRLLSASYVPAAGAPGYNAMLDAVERVFHQHQRGGEVVLEYDLEIIFGRLG
jgi:SAM-dependent methyltransferase